MDQTWTPRMWALNQDADIKTGPEPTPLRAPVFIHDAVTPWGRDTMLLKLLREQSSDQDE